MKIIVLKNGFKNHTIAVIFNPVLIMLIQFKKKYKMLIGL